MTKISLLAYTCIVAFFGSIGVSIRSPLTTPFAVQKGASIAEAGYVVASVMVAGAVFCIPFGFASDRFGRRKMIISGLLVTCAGSVGFIPALNPYHMMITYFIAGVGMAFYSPSITAYVGDISHSDRVGQSVGWYVTSMQIGTVFGNLLGGFIAQAGGYPLAYACSAIAMLSAAIIATKLRSPVALTTEKTVDTPKMSNVKKLTLLLATPIVLASWSAYFCNNFATGGLNTFLSLYILSVGLPLSLMGILFSLQNITGVASQFIVSIATRRAGDRFDFSYILIPGLVLLAVVIRLPTLFTDFGALAVIMALIATGAGMVIMGSQILLTAAVDFPVRGLAMGVYTSLQFAGMLTVDLLGNVVESYGYSAVFDIASIVLFVEVLIVCGLVFVSKRKHTLKMVSS